MRIAYLDCFSGLSGDMFLGAAVAAGVDFEKLQAVTRALGLDAELRQRRVKRGSLAATKIDVLVGGKADQPLDLETSADDHDHEHEAHHAHQHEHEHNGHSHEHSHAHIAEHAHSHRGLPEIREIIARAPIRPVAQDFALHAFELLAQAEAKVHDSDPEEIHFHEVGSEDAIVDIVCAAVAFDLIAADHWFCSALNVGSGTVRCAHGVLPVPAPATVELLRGLPVYSSGIQKEMLTPTGAAILRALHVHYAALPAMTVSAMGYGAGARELEGGPNVTRLTLGSAITLPNNGLASDLSAIHKSAGLESDTVVVLEANLDDMNPQLCGWVLQKLLDSGALDAFAVPVQMKKGRPGILLTVLALPAGADALTHLLLTETTTLGVRSRVEQRRILGRKHVTVESPWGPIRVKLGLLPNGEIANCAPEFEDCRKAAESAGVPLKTVLQQALRLYLASAAAGTATAGDGPKVSFPE